MKFRISFICLFIALILRGSPTLHWKENQMSLAGYLSILEDSKGDKTIEDILQDTLHWQTYPSDYLQLGYRNSYFWVRLVLDFEEIPSEKLYWWFDISAPQDLQFYHISNDSIQKYIQTGINFPFAQRDVLNRLFILSIQAQRGEKTILLARLHNDVGSILGYSYLNTVSDFALIDRKKTGLWVISFSFLFFSAMFSFGLWLVFKERIYAYYCAYLLCAFLLLVSVNGFGYEWFWSNSPVFANATKVLWTYGLVGFLMLFVYHLLYEVVKDKIILKRINQFIISALCVSGLIALSYPLYPPSLLPILLSIANGIMLMGIGAIFIMLIFGIYKRYPPAYYFLWAFIPVALMGVLMLARNAGFIKSIYLQSSFVIMPAFCIEIILLFVALMKRFQTLLKNQQEKLQMELESQYRLQHERERISRDLHDNVGAQLSYIISNIEHDIDTPNPPKNRLIDVAEAAKNAILNLRETIWAINNEQITVEDFYDRFKLYATNQVKNRLDVRLIFTENIVQNHILNPNQALNLYRISQEALTNALKYAQASIIEVFIKADKSPFFQIVLKDNGKGFDTYENTPNTSGQVEGGYGLKNMKARATDIGAGLHIHSQINGGTTIIIEIV